MDLNLPPTTPQPDESTYQNASTLPVVPEPTPLEQVPLQQPTEVQAPPLIPVLRKPRLRIGRLIILILCILAILAGLSYGGFRAYRYFSERQKTTTTTGTTVEFLPVSLYLNEVPFTFSTHISWRTELPTSSSQTLRIYPSGDTITSHGKEAAAVTIQIFDNPKGLTAKQLGTVLDKQLGKETGLLQEGTIGIGLQTYAVGRKSGDVTIFVSLPNKKYMTIEQPLFEKASDSDKATEIYRVFTRSLRID